jgi:PAS domain S-box-containing protein
MAARPSAEKPPRKPEAREKMDHDVNQLNQQLQKELNKYKQAFESTRKAEKVFRSIIDSSADAIAIFDLNGKVRYISPSFTELFGWQLSEVIGKPIPFLPESEREKTSAMAVELILRGIPCNGLVTKRYKKDGSLVNVSMSASRFHDHDGKPEGMFVILHDISDRKRLEDRLLQAQKMQALGTLAGGIAHDFNNIIFSIIGYTEMILEDTEHNATAKRNLKQVLKAANRAKDLVSHIRTFSQQQGSDRKPLLLQAVISEAFSLLKATVPASIAMKQQLDDTCGPVLADPTQIHQLMMNLGTNAFYAMRDNGGTFKIHLSEVDIDSASTAEAMGIKPGLYVKIEVSDTGCGMEPSVKKRIFEPFFTTKEPGDGTGLGLSVVHGIIKDYGGSIQVFSEPQTGSTFNIYLPRIDADVEIEKTPTQTSLPEGSEHILIVDDEEQNIQMLQQMLERLGYRVTGRTSGMDALATFRAQPDKFDLVITDLSMPGMTGTDLAREVHEIRPGMAIILCTGFSEMVSEEKAHALGIRKVLMKPAVTAEIASAVRTVIDSETDGKSGFCIMVVDDDETMRLMLRQHLEEAGYKIIDAANGAEASELLEQEMVNLVLTDVRMPEMDGFELMAHISSHYPSIPVIVISAYGSPETTRTFEDMGSLQVLDKPVDLEDLDRRITECLLHASHGGTMTGISVASFLQLIAMEQKTCLLEVYNRHQGKGYLVIQSGILYDAGCEKLKGEEAALNILAWENVTLNFKALPKKKLQRKITTDLMSLLLESLKIKDEAEPMLSTGRIQGHGGSLAESLMDSVAAASAPEDALAPPDDAQGERKLENLLLEMVRGTREALFVGVFDRDGVDVAHQVGLELDTRLFETQYAQIMNRIEKTVADLTVLGNLEEAVTQTHNAWVLIRLLNPTHFLAIIVSRKSTLGNARIIANKYMAELNQHLEGASDSD